MSTRNDGTSLDLDHVAEFMVYLSTASSFWFSLNLSYDFDHDFHLSNNLVCLHMISCSSSSSSSDTNDRDHDPLVDDKDGMTTTMTTTTM